MDERKNIKIPPELFERHNKQRQELGLSWPEYIDGQAPATALSADEIREIVRDETTRTLRDELDALRR